MGRLGTLLAAAIFVSACGASVTESPSLTASQPASPSPSPVGGDLGGAPSATPGPAWERHVSKRFHYELAHPADWDVDTSDQWDQFYSPKIAQLQALRDAVPADATLEQVAAAEVSSAERDGFTLDANEAYTLDGVTGRFLTFHGTVSGIPSYQYEAFTIRGGYEYFVGMLTPIEDDSADRALFEQMLSTFRFDRNVWGLAAGDCFTSLPLMGSAGQTALFVGGVDGFEKVACTDPHTGEVMAVLSPQATKRCDAFFADYVGRAIEGSRLALLAFTPVAADYAPPDVTGVCVVTDPSGPSTGSVAGTGR